MSQGIMQETQPDISKEKSGKNPEGKSGDAFPFVLELKVSQDFSSDEPLPVSGVTSTGENHIQWQGAFLEDKELNTAAASATR